MIETPRPASAPVAPAVVTLPVEIDAVNADGVGEDLRAAIARGAKTVVADMTATTFCDSWGVRALVLAREQAATCGAELRVVASSPAVLRVLALLGVDCWLAIYPRLEEALAAGRAARVKDEQTAP
jgi:anti-anti-sigma factor